MEGQKVKPDKDYGCDDCRMLQGHRCKLWQVKVKDPHDSHCEVVTHYLWKGAD